MTMRPRFHIIPIDYPPAPWAVRDRELQYTIERCPTWDAAVIAADRATSMADFEFTPLRDTDRIERCAETGEVLA